MALISLPFLLQLMFAKTFLSMRIPNQHHCHLTKLEANHFKVASSAAYLMRGDRSNTDICVSKVCAELQ